MNSMNESVSGDKNLAENNLAEKKNDDFQDTRNRNSNNSQYNSRNNSDRRPPFKRKPMDNRRRNDDNRKDLIEYVASIRRVSKVTAGGTRFSFSALVIVGDQEGKVGIGTGNDKELSNARMKANSAAKKNMVTIPLRFKRTIHYDITNKYNASIVVMKSAREGTGVIAGGVLRGFFNCLGVKDIVAKGYGSTSPHNMLLAAYNALISMESPKKIADRRRLKVVDIMSQSKKIKRFRANGGTTPKTENADNSTDNSVQEEVQNG